MSESADWTRGVAAIRFQRCACCAHLQYFRRDFCAACGSLALTDHAATGEGTIYAASLVCRAATPETRAHVPYNIVLVDMREGFRIMAHGDHELANGDPVTARFVTFAGGIVPYFGKAK
ncbi:Zn-ribbon domain-containing OB-fold protein [Bradyrhizobium sp. HKCCYLRH2060]|uniref:Zn-ribbon domain-containing OB-fold protein n=1 Tax=Bradyrhizobium TaxID=374 RepID=UPI002916B7CF|nr:OB-fold domain-containing protein [Bradyrhizobium sp. SZCCHNR3003]